MQTDRSKQTILVVEDDEFFRREITELLAEHYSVSEVPSGLAAKQILALNSYDLILSDMQMPHFTGLELLEWVKDKHPTKFILMSGFGLTEHSNDSNVNPDGTISKPFSASDLLALIRSTLPAENNENLDQQDHNIDGQFCKIPFSDFVMGKEAEFDIYLRLSEFKYVRILHIGGRFSDKQIEGLKGHKIEFVYVSKAEFSKLVNFNIYFSKVVANRQGVDPEKKERFLRYTGEMLVQHTFMNGLNKAALNMATEFSGIAIRTMSETPHMQDLLMNFNEHADFLYAHSLAVSMFSVLLGQSMGWVRPQILFKLSMAGLFHDIGKKEIPREILTKSRIQTSQKERELIETHALRGKEILEAMPEIPADVVAVAFEHHENVIGSGYPRRIDPKRIHPLTHLVTVADAFANYTVKNPARDHVVSAREAVQIMEAQSKMLYDPAAFAALKTVVET